MANIKHKIGILGMGSMGTRHARNLEALGCEVSCYDTKEKEEGVLYLYTREEMIDWADAIVVATPTSQHYADITTLPRDKPLFVEKPLVALPLQWATVSTANILMVGYNLRFHSAVKRAKAWMGQGLIGKPVWARFTCGQFSDKPDYLQDGVILNWSHEIDLALFLLGPANLITAAGRKSPENLADIILEHSVTRCQTVVHLDYLTRFERRGFIIVGEDGTIEADLVSRQVFIRDNRGSIPEIYYGRDNYDRNYLEEGRAFIARLENKIAEGCTAEEAQHVVNICLLAKEYIRAR